MREGELVSDRETHEDPEDIALVESLVGRTIVKVTWECQCGGREWEEHEMATLWLDDGRIIEFGSFGYDAWGATVREVQPSELVERTYPAAPRIVHSQDPTAGDTCSGCQMAIVLSDPYVTITGAFGLASIYHAWCAPPDSAKNGMQDT
jgi:hypothetical protein